MDWFVGKSKMAQCILSKDWSKTPLGPIETWPQLLKTTVNLCLNTNFPISISWGKNNNLIYNDGFRAICGDKHPGSLGQDFKECWKDAWPVIGLKYEEALAGSDTFIENERVFMNRFGYLEETFFTFSYSPIRGNNGEVLGIFQPVTETTEKMLNERRGRILREIAARTNAAETIQDAAQLTLQCLGEHELDIPFSLLYFFNENNHVELKGSTGLKPGELASPEFVDLNQNENQSWPFYQVTNNCIIELDLNAYFDNLICSPYPEPIQKALMLSIDSATSKQPLCVLIVGVSSRRTLDDSYRAFYEMLQIAITHAINKAGAYEQEKRRAEALAEIDKAKTTFFNNVSHEFRTPLTLMLGPLEEVLSSDQLPMTLRPTLDIVYRNCVRLLKLVNNLLDFSRIEAQRVEANFEAVDLTHFTIDLASHFISAFEQAQIQFNINCEEINKPVYIDREMWEKIVLNLLSNAFKYTINGSITLSLKQVRDHIELTISDTGCGIANEELPKIFDRFYRVKGNAGRTHEGTGIGLSLVQQLVSLLGGTIQVQSTVEQGTTFTVEIPFNNDHLPNETQKNKVTPPLNHSKAFVQETLGLIHTDLPKQIQLPVMKESIIEPAKLERIMLAEDNADMRNYLFQLLSPFYQVSLFSNGKEALEAIINNPPNLILSDIMMPIMDGLELVKQVRAIQSFHDVPIILLSARAGEESLIGGIDTGADDYLVKPFSAKELLARIKQHILMQKLRQETVRQKKEFISCITHDLRSPLTAIISFTSLIYNNKCGSITTDQKEYLGYVLKSGEHLVQLINNILDDAKTEAGKMEFKPRKVHLTRFIKESLQMFQSLANDKNIHMHFEKKCNFHTAMVDPLRLRQVLFNYLSNAIKFTPSNGMIKIKLSSGENNMFRIDVKDNGIGIKQEDLPRIFIDFQQIAPKNGDYKGTGLGLALSKRIVEAQNGKVSVKSAFGKGTTFSVFLPRLTT